MAFNIWDPFDSVRWLTCLHCHQLESLGPPLSCSSDNICGLSFFVCFFKLSSSVIYSHEIQRTYKLFLIMGCHVFHYLRANARNALLISIFIFLFIFWLKLNDPATFLISFGYEQTTQQTTAQLCPLISPKLSKTRVF